MRTAYQLATLSFLCAHFTNYTRGFARDQAWIVPFDLSASKTLGAK